MNNLSRGAAAGGGALVLLALPLAAHQGAALHLHAGELAGAVVVMLVLALLPARASRRNGR